MPVVVNYDGHVLIFFAMHTCSGEARRPVPIKSFEKYVAQRHRNSDQIFSEEYEVGIVAWALMLYVL